MVRQSCIDGDGGGADEGAEFLGGFLFAGPEGVGGGEEEVGALRGGGGVSMVEGSADLGGSSGFLDE